MDRTPRNKPHPAAPELRDDWDSVPLYVREKQIRNKIVPISHGALWDWVSKKTFPAPVALSSGVTAWKRGDLKAWAEGAWTPEGKGETT